MRLYVRLSCEVLTDAKILQVGPEAAFVWVRGLLYAKEHLTDGFIPRGALPLIALGAATDSDGIVAKLLDAGLWREVDGGWHVGPERWAKHQTTREQVEAIRQAWRDRKGKQRGRYTVSPESHAGVTRDNSKVTPPESESESESESEKIKKEGSRKRPTLSAVADPPAPIPANGNGTDPTDDHGTPDELAIAWNMHLHPPLAKVRTPLNPSRLKAARIRLKEHPTQQYWLEVFAAIRGSPFCCGQNDRGWRANFDWLLKPGSADKALEGMYQNVPKPPVLQRYV